MSEHKNDPPLDTLRDGSVNIKLWRVDSKNGPFPSATIGNTYQDRQSGALQESRSFSHTDLLKLEKLLPKAQDEMAQWKEYFRMRAQQPELPQLQQAEDARKDSMAQKRDAAMRNAKPGTRRRSRAKSREPEAR